MIDNISVAFHGIVLVKRVGVAVASVTDSVENEQAASARRLVVELRFLKTATRNHKRHGEKYLVLRN